MKLISISGLDGSGKSTQIEMLKNSLEKQGKKIFYFHSVSFSIANRFIKAKKNKDNSTKAVTSAGKLKILLRKIALIIDVFRFRSLQKKLSADYDYMLTDRYFYDQIINIIYLENSGLSKKYWWQKIAEKYIIRPNVSIYLQVAPQEIMRREREIEQGIEYLNKKKVLYDALHKKWRLLVVDGGREKEAVHNTIVKLLNC